MFSLVKIPHNFWRFKISRVMVHAPIPHNTMPAQKINIHATAKVLSDDERLGSEELTDDGNESVNSEGQNSGSESDSLDSVGSRKRRRIAPVEEEEEDEAERPRIAITTLPSRINKNKEPTISDLPSLASQVPNNGILAATDPNTTFGSLEVKPWLVGSLNNMAIKRPTGIQKGCIPEILKGRDCIGGSRTGSGKTVAFAVPILQKWAEDPFGIFALVLTPTR
jgi:ATP-dependent RNA helicase DDX49/DBP8